MKIGKWTKVRIIKCTSKDYWYTDYVGKIVEVKKHDECSWGVEERSTGYQIAPHDYEEL